MSDDAWRSVGAGAARGRPISASTHAMLATLTMVLVAAFVWWRLAAQRRHVESYWERPLAGSAQLIRVRADEWLAARQDNADVLAALAVRGRGPGSAFELALATEFAEGDVPYVTIRDGDSYVWCRGVPVATQCSAGTELGPVPSPGDPSSRRIRTVEDGRALLAVVSAIPSSATDADGASLVVWIDPERQLIPRLLLTRGSIPEAVTIFVRRSRDSATVVTRDSAGTGEVRRRLAIEELPPLIARPALDSELVIGVGPGGERALAGHMYSPRLRWHIYRALAESAAYSTFRREALTEGVLAFLLGSFVIGALVWSVRGQREHRVRAELLQARLESLQAQLRPHFLFNALNTIATLVHDDPEKAEAMLLRLSELLRISLEQWEHAEIPLASEIAIFDAYVAVERVRFGDALRVTRQVDDAALDLPVPRWILQPLAENAFKHGAAYTRGMAAIHLQATLAGNTLQIIVGNDACADKPPEAPREGVGLRNTRERLATLYGSAASLTLRPRPAGGTDAVLEIPVNFPASDTGEHLVVASTDPTGERAVPAPEPARPVA